MALYEVNVTAVSPSSNETFTASGYFMNMKKRETIAKITELRNNGICPIPENFNNYYAIRYDDCDDTPCTVENHVASYSIFDFMNKLGTIIMDEKYSDWFNANAKTDDPYVDITKMEITAFSMLIR
jgi:hypothetical protein